MTPKFMELHSTKFHEDFEGFDDAYIGCNCYGNNNNEELDHKLFIEMIVDSSILVVITIAMNMNNSIALDFTVSSQIIREALITVVTQAE